jgi:hypothetical protein
MRDLEGGESRRSNETSAYRFRNSQAHEALRDGTLERPVWHRRGKRIDRDLSGKEDRE